MASSRRATSPRGSARAFATPTGFRRWLATHHERETELFVRCFKVHAVDRGMGYSDALDEALCFGWIDGVRFGIDADSFSVRFSPRTARSIWSAVNIARARSLEAAGRMRPPGRAAFRARTSARSRVYSFESTAHELDAARERKLRANARAWRFFSGQPPWYQRTSRFWVMSAKREETRAKRFAVLMASSEQGKCVPPLARVSSAGRRTPKG